MNFIRSFIAINLSPEIKKRLETLIIQMKTPDTSFVRWVSPANTHLTLKFLGEIPSRQIEDVRAIFSDEAWHIPVFEIATGEIGVFPNIRRPRVLWVGVNTTPALQKLHRMVDGKCAMAGFETDQRQFSPHLTLGRINTDLSKTETDSFSRLIQSCNLNLESVSMQVNAIYLYKSELARSGARYSVLAEKKFSPNVAG